MSLLRNSAWAAAAAITLAVSRFILAAILARTLPQDVFGQYAYGQWLVDLSFLLCSLGVTSAASRYVAEYRHDPALLSAFIRRWQPFAVGLPVLASCGLLVAAWLSEMKLTSLGLTMLAAWTLTSGFWAMQTSALIGMQRFDLIFKANLVSALIMLVGALFLPLGSDPHRIFGLMAVACLSGSIIGLIASNQLTRGGSQTSGGIDWRGVRGYAFNMWFSALVASLVWSRGEFPVVKSMLGDSAVAHYAAALAIFGAAVQAIMLAVGGVGPHLTSLWGQGKVNEAIDLGRDIMDLQLALCGIGSLGVIFFGAEMISIAFSEAYRDAAGPLSTLCLGLLSFAVSSQSHLLQIKTNARFNRNSIVVGLAFLYALAFILIPQYGLTGAAVARVSAMFLIGVITLWFAVRHLGKGSVSWRNLLLVFGTLLLSLFGNAHLSTGVEKIPYFLAGVILMVIFLRGVDGNIVVLRVFRRLTNHRA